MKFNEFWIALCKKTSGGFESQTLAQKCPFKATYSSGKIIIELSRAPAHDIADPKRGTKKERKISEKEFHKIWVIALLVPKEEMFRTKNYVNSTLEPIARSADILISEYGALDLEDETNGSLLLNGTDGSSTNAGGRFRFELATDDNININYPNV